MDPIPKGLCSEGLVGSKIGDECWPPDHNNSGLSDTSGFAAGKKRIFLSSSMAMRKDDSEVLWTL